ncbi:hypothetical protein K7395_18130 [Streptomyces filamentosus]|uniref:Uncharacterized protein n=2 Tax=Streptomyces filamentosus TaxID=67294 RepID=A0ABY4UW84_STRFL|nr:MULTISPECIES: hypothetical protein [Streptomyces]ESU50092.1 integral membrane protein [Streptomyces sp. HCCB10043]MYR79943.1 hypothetical protein [Streptomyces sp. SID5466]USC48510.1 hypothetical protein K7395_18130 [Streptomyces filamentosus]
MTTLSLGPSPARRDALTRRIRLLVAATIAYNVIEAVVALTAGTLASSSALIGFGLDSVIEVSSAAAVAWQFSALAIAGIAVKEGREAWRGKGCCAPTAGSQACAKSPVR